MRKLAILGSTGSIGTQALDVAARHSDRFAVTALVAHSSSEKLFEQVRQFHPQIAALSVEPKEIPADIRESCQWMFGENVLLDVVRACDADDVLVSVVGVVGLAAVMEALACGKRVLLANKEPLVAGGELATKLVGVMIKTFGPACEGHMDKERYEFCWIVDFPMYEIGDESGELEFCHNPFSMPAGGLDVLLKAERGEIDPLTITADQYDLVCNGVELSSGAVRNHDPEIMIKAFELVRLGEEDVKAKFPAMYNAFCYGAPPHAGIAPGVDRMVMLLAGEDSIREIIPFPMNKNAQDIMMGAPSEVTQKQLDELHIAVTAHEEE